jgi:TFIIF-interacting CTD phosphatase-like protein
MIEWFDERYISRDEHQKVVDYYTKLVAQLHREVRALRAVEADAKALENIVEHSKHITERELRRSAVVPSDEPVDNVIRVDFCRRSRPQEPEAGEP